MVFIYKMGISFLFLYTTKVWLYIKNISGFVVRMCFIGHHVCNMFSDWLYVDCWKQVMEKVQDVRMMARMKQLSFSSKLVYFNNITS